MRLNRMVDQRQRLRDLMSEVQENHTDIQRLWKQIDAGGIVWPVGIAAAPPIEEIPPDSGSESSSSSSSSSEDSSGSFIYPCDGCFLPAQITVSLSSSGDDNWDGTFTLNYNGNFGGTYTWGTSACIALPSPFVVGFNFFTYYKVFFTCNGSSTSVIATAYGNSSCGPSPTPYPYQSVSSSDTGSFDCDPLMWSYEDGDGYSAIVTE